MTRTLLRRVGVGSGLARSTAVTAEVVGLRAFRRLVEGDVRSKAVWKFAQGDLEHIDVTVTELRHDG